MNFQFDKNQIKVDLIKHLNNLIAEGNLKDAIKELRLIFSKSPMLNEIILQSARYSDLQEKIRLGTLDFETASISKNKITHAILELVSEIDSALESSEDVRSDLRSHEVITQVFQNHKGTGDNVAGDKIVYIRKKEYLKELTFLQKVNPNSIIGREKELNELHRLLWEERQSVLITGMGGLGKTTLAATYLFHYYDRYNHITWITQNDEEIATDFIQNTGLINSLGLSIENQNPNDLFLKILQRLGNIKNEPKLFVIDNASPSIEKYLDKLPNQPSWHLLVTSREKIEGLTPLYLDFLSPPEATQLFQKYCTRIHDVGQINKLLKIVDFHTLTIEVLAKMAERQHFEIEILKKALKVDLRANVKVKHSKGKVDRMMSYLTNIFDLSRLSEDESWLMKQFVCLPPEFYPYDFLKELIDPGYYNKDGIFSDTLTSLTEKGWLIKGKLDKYKMHRVIREVVNNNMKFPYAELTSLTKNVSVLLSYEDEKDSPIEKFQYLPFGVALMNAAISHRESSYFIEICHNVGEIYYHSGFFKKAKDFFYKSLLLQETNTGPKHSSLAIRYRNIGKAYWRSGEFKDAVTYLKKGINILESNLNFELESPDLALIYRTMAAVKYQLGEINIAFEYLYKALKIQEKVLNNFDAEIAITYANMCTLYYECREYEKASHYLNKAVLIQEKVLHPKHPDLALSYIRYAVIYSDTGEFEKASALFQRALSIQESNLDSGHPDLALTYLNIGRLHIILGRNKIAKKYLEKSLVILKSKLESNHPWLVENYLYIGQIHLDEEEIERSLKILYQAKSIIDEYDQPHKFLQGYYQLLLAKAFFKLEHHREAIDSACQSEKVLSEVQGQNSYFLTEVRTFIRENRRKE